MCVSNFFYHTPTSTSRHTQLSVSVQSCVWEADSAAPLEMLPEPEPQEQAHVCKTPLGNLTPFPCVTGQNSSFFSQNVLVVIITVNS